MGAQVLIVGQAVIHGIPNNGSPITITGYASFLLDKIEGEHNFESYFTKDAQGNDASATGFNEHADVILDFTPSSPTSQAAAAAIPQFLGPLSSVTLANCKVAGEFQSSSAAVFNQTGLYLGGARFTGANTGAWKLTGLKVRVYANAAQNASMATQIS